ncbi:hypothetical protein CY34DRAFT_642763 [Suillus luteus UH-Slu-Lm8-n1]|uniref:Uncharacterized protein n=1 Tax=Suillus luteus UH-Slu-Lm8-n1 TaxID=930992 RepID=A0A0D0BDP1_9AGAM|nr:hypothetical protein CY34DRAFT_642763 [Suillus luteus UH-Slu-Lm8-n1]
MAYLCSLEVHNGIHPGSHLTAEITQLNVSIQLLCGIGNKRRAHRHRTCAQTFELCEAWPATQRGGEYCGANLTALQAPRTCNIQPHGSRSNLTRKGFSPKITFACILFILDYV